MPLGGAREGGREAPAVPEGARPLPPAGRHLRPEQLRQGLPVLGDEGVDVDQAGQALRHALGHPGDDGAPVAVPDQEDVLEVLVDEDVHDVLDVGVQPDRRRGEVDPLAEAGEAHPEHLVPGLLEQRGERPPLPGPAE